MYDREREREYHSLEGMREHYHFISAVNDYRSESLRASWEAQPSRSLTTSSMWTGHPPTSNALPIHIYIALCILIMLFTPLVLLDRISKLSLI